MNYRKILKGGRQELVEKWKLSEERKKTLLEYKTTIDCINSIDIIKLETILSGKLYDWEWNRILNPEIVNSLNSLDIERLKIIFKAPRCNGVENILYEQKIIERIQSLDIERLKILINGIFVTTYEGRVYCTPFDRCIHRSRVEVVKCILESRKAIDVIKSMDIKFMKSMRKHKNLLDHIFVELSKRKGPAYIKRLKIFFEHNEYYDRHGFMKAVLKEPHIFDKMTSIDIEKFKLIDLDILSEIIQNQKRIDLINCFDSEKLRFLIHFDLTLLWKMCEELQDKIDWNDATNSLNIEGLRFMIEYRNKKVESHDSGESSTWLFWLSVKFGFGPRKNDVIPAESINFIGNEKLWYVVMFDKYWKLLRDGAIKNGIHFLNIEKLKVLLREKFFVGYCDEICVEMGGELDGKYCDKYDGYVKLCEILRNEETLKLFQLISLEKLKITIEAMTDWYTFMAEFKGESDIKKNLNFAIALHKAGLMEKFDCKFLSDNEAVKQAITEAFPRDWTIDNYNC